MKISELVSPERIVALTARQATKEGAIKALTRVLGKTPEVDNEKELLRAVSDRERILSTGIGSGIAIPHAKIRSVSRFVAALGISKNGIDFDSLDGKPAHVIVMIAGPEGDNETYLRILARFTEVLKFDTTRERIIEVAKNSTAVMDILDESH